VRSILDVHPIPAQKQTTVGSDARTLEINFQRGVERELKGLILCFTHWVKASANLVLRSKPHEYWRGSIIRLLTPTSKRKCGFSSLYSQQRELCTRWHPDLQAACRTDCFDEIIQCFDYYQLLPIEGAGFLRRTIPIGGKGLEKSCSGLGAELLGNFAKHLLTNGIDVTVLPEEPKDSFGLLGGAGLGRLAKCGPSRGRRNECYACGVGKRR